MTVILIIIGFCIAVIFRNDWKKTVYLLILIIPFFGFIQFKILHLTSLPTSSASITHYSSNPPRTHPAPYLMLATILIYHHPQYCAGSHS